MRRNILISTILIISIYLLSCNKPATYDRVVHIPENGWNADSLATFSIAITDTVSVHHIYINTRNTVEYSNSNLFLFVETTSPSGAMLRDTVELFLADTKGKWTGKGFGKLRDNRYPYKRYIRFPEIGEYTISLQQGMRTQKLMHISSVGIRVEQSK